MLDRVDQRFHIERATAMRDPDVLRMSYRAGYLAWDAQWRAPLLDEFASHHHDGPFPRTRR